MRLEKIRKEMVRIMNKNRWLAGAMAVTIAGGSIGAAGLTAHAAEDTESSKEEVIYIMTDADGKVDNIDAVNIFGKGSVTDYGDYSSVKMLNNTDKINQDGDEVTFSTDKEKVYYQGTMDADTQIPWNISFGYTLDGKEISPEDLAGKSGVLEIHIKVDKNEKCTSDFYDSSALQATLTLDTDKCENIQADGATLANVGSSKQISYTVLPGNGLDAVVSADVKDFEMDAASINAVKMNLDVDIDDDELMDKVTQIMDAARELNDGVAELSDGTETLTAGGDSLVSGVNSVYDGVESLDSGITALNGGIQKLQTVLENLNARSSSLTEGSAKVTAGISSAKQGTLDLQTSISYDSYKAVMAQNGLNIDELQAGNTDAINTISTQITNLQASIAQLKDQPDYNENAESQAIVVQMQTQIDSLNSVVTVLTGDNVALSGAAQYYGTVAQGAGDLANGIGDLGAQYSELDQGITDYTNGVATITSAYADIADGSQTVADSSSKLVNGSSGLKAGAAELSGGMSSLQAGVQVLCEGTQEFYDQTDGMDTKIEDTMDEMLDSITGGDSATESFVSEKNGTIDSVQFVIKTAEISKEDTKSQETTKETKQSVWKKFVQLFK